MKLTEVVLVTGVSVVPGFTEAMSASACDVTNSAVAASREHIPDASLRLKKGFVLIKTNSR